MTLLNAGGVIYLAAYGFGTGFALSIHAVKTMSRSILAPAASLDAVKSRDSADPAPVNPPVFSNW